MGNLFLKEMKAYKDEEQNNGFGFLRPLETKKRIKTISSKRLAMPKRSPEE